MTHSNHKFVDLLLSEVEVLHTDHPGDGHHIHINGQMHKVGTIPLMEPKKAKAPIVCKPIRVNGRMYWAHIAGDEIVSVFGVNNKPVRDQGVSA